MRDAGFEFRGGACGCELVAVGEYCRCGCGDAGFGWRGRSIGLALDADAVGDGSMARLEMRRTLDADAAMLALDVEGFGIGFGRGRFGWELRSGTAQRLVSDAGSSWIRWMRMRRCGLVHDFGLGLARKAGWLTLDERCWL
mmetsp:Transcript_17339/g.37438  ORF Transcript_17339/g.37438 Transcript_17339/m.37438 type:complete len:141 (+) Transcript_17339:180-602(+)